LVFSVWVFSSDVFPQALGTGQDCLRMTTMDRTYPETTIWSEGLRLLDSDDVEG
jgi:hypothetical protein